MSAGICFTRTIPPDGSTYTASRLTAARHALLVICSLEPMRANLAHARNLPAFRIAASVYRLNAITTVFQALQQPTSAGEMKSANGNKYITALQQRF